MKQKSLWLKTSEAYAIIARLGGVQEVARILQLNQSSVARWMYPVPSGRGGVIPPKHRERLLRYAAALGVELEEAA